MEGLGAESVGRRRVAPRVIVAFTGGKETVIVAFGWGKEMKSIRF